MTDVSDPLPADAVVDVVNLRKCYGDLVAVEDVSFSVAEGEIFGILGPNGAGKTTTVECITGLRRPDSGRIRVLGLNPQTDRTRLHELVGVQLQDSQLPAQLRVHEILRLYRSFYRNPADTTGLLDTLGLASKRDAQYRSLSGGQKQRLSIALALIGRPKIAVLDEMTTGLDPAARHATWDFIENIRDRGTTMILVTHFMDEAQRLCDRLALISHGQIAAAGTPAQLAEQAGTGKQVRFTPGKPFSDDLLTTLPEVSALHRQGKHIVVHGTGQLVNTIISTLAAAGITADDIEMQTATLEDAFLTLTGTQLHNPPTEAAETAVDPTRRLVSR